MYYVKDNHSGDNPTTIETLLSQLFIEEDKEPVDKFSWNNPKDYMELVKWNSKLNCYMCEGLDLQLTAPEVYLVHASQSSERELRFMENQLTEKYKLPTTGPQGGLHAYWDEDLQYFVVLNRNTYEALKAERS